MRSRLISRDLADALLQHGDAGVDDLLALLGGLVFGVLAQVAQLARALDLLGELDLQLALEDRDLVVETLENPLFHRPNSDCTTVCYAAFSRPRALRCAPSRAATIPSSPLSARLPRTPIPPGARVLLDGAHLVRRGARRAGCDFEVMLVAASRNAARHRGRSRWRTNWNAAACRSWHGRRPRVRRREPDAVALGHRRDRATPPGRRRPRLCARPDAFVLVAADVQDPGNVGGAASAPPRLAAPRARS